MARQNYEKRFQNSLEPKLKYGLRVGFMGICFVLIIALAVYILIVLLFFLNKALNSCLVKDELYDERVVARNAGVMNIMHYMPFSRFLLREAQDCPICLESFTEEDQVVQLKCSPLHIFHGECLNQYLSRLPQNRKLCPLCRQPAEFNDQPVPIVSQ